MTEYLLDTNICIYYLKNRFGLAEKLRQTGWRKCAVSEITVGELLYGVTNSDRPERIKEPVETFIQLIRILPVSACLREFAHQKAALRRTGTLIPDFDILIGATAIVNGLTLITNNTKHFNRLQGIRLEDWTNTDS